LAFPRRASEEKALCAKRLYKAFGGEGIPPPPPSFTFSEIDRYYLGASHFGTVFTRENPGIFKGERKHPAGNMKARTNLF